MTGFDVIDRERRERHDLDLADLGCNQAPEDSCA